MAIKKQKKIIYTAKFIELKDLGGRNKVVTIEFPSAGLMDINLRRLYKYNDLYYISAQPIEDISLVSRNFIHIYNMTITRDGRIKSKRDSNKFREDEERFNQAIKFNKKAKLVGAKTVNIINDKIVLNVGHMESDRILQPNIVNTLIINQASAGEVVLKEGTTTIYSGNIPAGLKHIDIPESVNCIEGKAFYNSNLEEIVIPPSVKRIGSGAFASCSKLRSIKFKGELKYIGEYCFLNCSSLERLELPNGIRKITNGLIANCVNMKSIKIPPSVVEVENFMGAGLILSINIEAPKHLKPKLDRLVGVRKDTIIYY